MLPSDNPENELVITNQMETLNQLQTKLQALGIGMCTVKKELESAMESNDWTKAIEALNKGVDFKSLVDSKQEFPEVSFEDIAKSLDDWSTQLLDDVKAITTQTARDVQEMLKSRMHGMSKEIKAKVADPGTGVAVRAQLEIGLNSSDIKLEGGTSWQGSMGPDFLRQSKENALNWILTQALKAKLVFYDQSSPESKVLSEVELRGSDFVAFISKERL